MSCVRYFNGTPHIVRYGMQSDKDEKGWIFFWRNGVRFRITVSRSDVRGTRFEKKWFELNHEPDPHGGSRDWVHNWELLCDCIISQCLDLLEELAPDGKEYWTTLSDYIHTPGYEVKVVADEKLGDAKAEVVSGPEIEGAYELGPLPPAEVQIVTDDMNGYRSEAVRVVDKEVDWRHGPHRVQMPDGTFYGLECVENYSRLMPDDKLINHSLERIRTHLKICNQCEKHPDGYPSRIPRVTGYVTDDTIPSENTEITEDSEPKPQPQSLIAGILLSDFPASKTLSDLVREAKTDPSCLRLIKENKTMWKRQTLDIVLELHTRGMACGGSEDGKWFYITQWLIHVDDKEQVWLDPSVEYFLQSDGKVDTVNRIETSTGSPEPDFEQAVHKDFQAVDRVYDEWLPEELAKIENPTDTARA